MTEILQQHLSKYISLSDEEYAWFRSHFRQLSFRKGQKIIKEGDTVTDEYFVLTGCLKTFYLNDDVRMHILQFGMPTWWTSDYNALYNGTKATINVDCITDAEVLALNGVDRERLCAGSHKAEHFFRRRTNGGYVALQKRLLSLMNNDAKTRYEELLKQYPELFQVVPKHLIAAYLGVSRETLSRLYAHTRKTGQ